MAILSILTFLPLIGAILLLLLPKESPAVARTIAYAVTGITLAATVVGIVLPFNSSQYHFQFREHNLWFPQFGVSYHVGVDGISLWLVVLTTFMSVLAVAISGKVEQRSKLFLALILALESFMIGAFVSLDLILFFTFFELTLFPMWALISIWGGEKRRLAAAKFFVYTFAGSIFMLIGIIALAIRVPTGISFDILTIQQSVASGQLWSGAVQLEAVIFWAFALAFLVKSPSFPVHTWMPITYSESPTVVPVLSSVMVKLGTYGLLRFCLPLFPDVIGAQVPIIMGLAVISIIYAGIVAAIQPEMRKLVAYSSISHMGFVVLGIFSLSNHGLMGAAYQQISHTITAGGLIILLGFLYERRPSKLFSDFGGLKAQMPLFATVFLIVLLGSVGLPFTNGFVGEVLALLGTFESGHAHVFGLNEIFAVAAGFGVVLSAAYLLYMFQQLFYGKVESEENRQLRDLKPTEFALAAVLCAVIVIGGVAPNLFFKSMEASVAATQMMAVNPPAQRPTWKDTELSIVTEGPNRGALVRGTEQVSAPVSVPSASAPVAMRGPEEH